MERRTWSVQHAQARGSWSLRLASVLAGLLALGGLLVACGDDGGGTTPGDGSDADGAGDTASVDVIEPCPATGALLQAAPLVMQFGPVSVGMTQTRELLLNNGGSGQLCVSAMDYVLDPVASPFLIGPLDVDGVPVTALNPGKRGAMTVTFMPNAEGSGITTLTLGSDNGGTASVSLSWTATAPVLSLGSVNLGFVTTFVFEGARYDTDPSYAETHAEGVSQVQVFSGAYGDGLTLPGADAVATVAVAKHYGGTRATLVVEQRSFADAEKTMPANPQAALQMADDVQPGSYPLDLDQVGDPGAAKLLVFDDDGLGGRCVVAVGSGSVVVGQAVGTTDSEGGAFAVTAGGVQLYPPAATPLGDLGPALALVGWSPCAE